ncbi:TrkH family potassium uptake protein [Paenalcaligenes sp. Me131]|uniref:TrkH family potassium uptake protein n=1 Tax=Paenalcaligenes sp. Me131 TaxID=3392636 RepID=UPI003D2C5301
MKIRQTRERFPFPVDRRTTLNASPPAVLALGFFLLIVLGSVLLSLPVSTQRPIGWFDALFMATSAVTVSGLAVVEPATTFTTTGQVILTILVQLGGLGIITFAVLAAQSIQKRISLNQQALALEAFNQTNVGKIHQTALAVIKISATIQIITILILGLWWTRHDPWKDAFYQAYFHVSMAFNNAGISLYDQSLRSMVPDTFSILTLSLMIILGGLGFPVLMNILQKRRWSKLQLYTRLILLGTLALNIVGFLAIWAFEANNPATLEPLPLGEQATAAWFQAIATRTAGFSTMSVVDMHDSSTMLMMMYMFIGGGSLSTASGIKLGTFIVLVAAVFSYIRHREEVVIGGRTISPAITQKALALAFITSVWFVFGVMFVTIFDGHQPFRSVLFEVMSAITTTGMGHGITPELTRPSQAMLAVLMFVGRLGPLTLVYTIARRTRSRIRYPETPFQVG